MSLHTFQAIRLSRRYIAEEEFYKLDLAMSSSAYDTENPYVFYCSIYDEGVILSVWNECSTQEESITETDFPTLYKLIKMVRKIDVRYIILSSNIYPFKDELLEEFNIKLSEWSEK